MFVTPYTHAHKSTFVISTFSFVSAFLMVPWALASNKFGRKPCLIVALYGTAFATARFGFSQSLYEMLFWRGFGGACSGTTVILRTLFSEVSDRSNQARSFSIYAFAGNFALLVGPVVGGSLSEPAKRIPWLFGNVKLLQNVRLSNDCQSMLHYRRLLDSTLLRCLVLWSEPSWLWSRRAAGSFWKR